MGGMWPEGAGRSHEEEPCSRLQPVPAPGRAHGRALRPRVLRAEQRLSRDGGEHLAAPLTKQAGPKSPQPFLEGPVRSPKPLPVTCAPSSTEGLRGLNGPEPPTSRTLQSTAQRDTVSDLSTLVELPVLGLLASAGRRSIAIVH